MSIGPAHEPAIPFVTVTNWVRAATQCGIDLAVMFQEEGIDVTQLHPETATIRREAMQRIMQRCVDQTRQRANGQHFPIVLGESFAFEYLSDIETFITTSATLRDATRSLEWIPPLINPFMAFSVAEQGHQARIVLQYNHPDATPDTTWHFTEAVFTTTLKFSRLLLGPDAFVERITLRHPQHEDAAHLARFFQAPIEYNAPVDALWFDRSMLDRPLRGAFPILHELAAQRVAQQLAQRTEHQQNEARAADTPQLVHQIAHLLNRQPALLGQGLDTVAQHLGVHARTLQRRLKDLGDSHSAIQDRVRYELAQQWLRDDTRSIEDISEQLGFSDRRSFTQAFTRWAGQTPSQFRRGPV
ncbi:MAG: AraC family transcriptional regulator ligand-binding domain-containing protein [Burkholderiales bacterium]|nr:AraC family transcriptional regulator ligand-binding domain-containing protein [Burkholderiales bacterium]